MESLDDRTRRYRDETLQELKALERRVEALKILIKTLDDNLPPPNPPKEPGVPLEKALEKKWLGDVAEEIIANCHSWKTVRQLAELKGFENKAKSNISTRCHYLWKRGFLERRERVLTPRNPFNHKEYEYRSVDPDPALWSGKKPRRGYGVFEKILREWFRKNDSWFTIHDLRRSIPELSAACHSDFRPRLLKLVREGFLKRREASKKSPRAPAEYEYSRE